MYIYVIVDDKTWWIDLNLKIKKVRFNERNRENW